MKQSIKALRRAELSQAAFETLVEHGIRHSTLERIARNAGVSKGVVLHHFQDKDALFEAVMRRANTLLRDGVIELLRHANTPVERLAAVLVGNFSEPVFHKEVCNAWISLCADVPYNPQNQRIQRIIDARVRSNLINALKGIPMQVDADAMAEQLAVSIDGLWLKASLSDERLDGDRCIWQLFDITRRMAPLSPETEQDLRAAIEKMSTVAKIVLQSNAFLQKVNGTLT